MELRRFWLVLALFVAGLAIARCHRSRELQILDEFLENRKLHDKRIPPVNKDNETIVGVFIFVSNLWDLNQKTMDGKADLVLGLEWTIPELEFTDLPEEEMQLTEAEMVEKFWKPEIVFPNSKTSEKYDSLVPNHSLHILNKTRLVYLVRVKLKFSCIMNLEDFPFDNQQCNIDIHFLNRNSGRLEWMADDRREWAPMTIKDGLILPQFEIEEYHTVPQCYKRQVAMGNYSCVTAVIQFQRRFGYHLVNTYLPTVLTVMVSWLTFWMDVHSVPGRTTLGVTTLLTITTKASDVQSTVAEVSYIKAIDIWMGSCTTFVFFALVEFIVANYRARHCEQPSGNPDIEANHTSGSVIRKTWSNIRSRSVDQISRVLFPVFFSVFNLSYWIYYTIFDKSSRNFESVIDMDP